MYHIPRLPEAVYVGLCRKIGSPTEVRIRREVMDTTEVVNKPMHIMKGLDRMRSGSKREGFRLSTSDDDFMLWPPDHKVICDLSQVEHYHNLKNTLILMECDDIPPGFTRLNLITISRNGNIRHSRKVIDNKVYLSSILFRNSYLRLLHTSSVATSSSVSHGPCSTFVITKDTEADADFAYCFHSNHWPIQSLQWIDRCRLQGWPSEIVASEILRSGHHVVPIGSKPENELEWRISFSQAEQKIICSMNHCQFLCYGLLKTFLKEVINFQNNSPVLCSYFTKTIVFWAIQTNHSLTWTPENLLSCFWDCFKLLIYMVNTGGCPNFFIPQNNMFRVKVIGSVQTSLFSQLYDLYCKGISCLLLSETIRPYLSQAILQRTLRFCTDESSIISSTELDITLFGEFRMATLKIGDLNQFVVSVKQLERVIMKTMTSYREVTLQWMTSTLFRNSAVLIQNSKCPSGNRKYFCFSSKISGLLKLSSKFGCISDILYLAMYYYRTRRYEHSLSCLKKAEEGMFVPYGMYNGFVAIDKDTYKRYMEDVPLGIRLRKALIEDIELHCEYKYIDELEEEQDVSRKNGMLSLYIPPVVMLHMLLVLNHNKLGDTDRSNQYLRNIRTLLLEYNRFYFPVHQMDISWQITAICQQTCGKYSEAVESYKYSLKQIPTHKIQEATLSKMKTCSS